MAAPEVISKVKTIPAERLPEVGERIGFYDDGYSERFGVVVALHDFFGCPMADVRVEGDWPEDELGEDGTVTVTVEQSWPAPASSNA